MITIEEMLLEVKLQKIPEDIPIYYYKNNTGNKVMYWSTSLKEVTQKMSVDSFNEVISCYNTLLFKRVNNKATKIADWMEEGDFK